MHATADTQVVIFGQLMGRRVMRGVGLLRYVIGGEGTYHMKTVLVLILTCTSIAAQTSSGLRHKYGSPVSETYVVRPGVMATFTFAGNGQPCEALIEPQRPSTPIKSSTARLTLKTLNEIIDELVPTTERGKPLMAGFVNMSCLPNNDCWGTEASYEKVFIYYNSSGKDEYRYATIQWRERSCHR